LDISIKSFEVYGINDKKKVVFRDEMPAMSGGTKIDDEGAWKGTQVGGL